MMRELPIEPPEPVEVADCVYCGGEIYEGDEVARLENGEGYVHSEWCSLEYARTIVYDVAGVIDRNKNIS